ncbi:MAG: SDR family oxidoreductase [Myxococcales bacterium]|nr:SDR family oxidoreductase [Myxococcales bacterium]
MNDKIVMITGASAGIGAALAEEVGRRGGTPVLLARRADALAAAAGRAGPRAHAIVADVTRRADLERAVAETVARFGHLDVLVNNAGRGITRPASEVTDDDLDEMWLINVKAVMYGVQAALPHFRARGRGHIVNVSSVLGRIPLFGPRAAYSAAKHALNALTANLRVELRAASPDLHVTLVLPGVVATEFGANARHGGVDSRAIPGAQPVAEVATVIADAIDRPCAEVYTRPEYKAQVAAYYAAPDLAEVEARPPFVTPPRP